MTPRIGTRKVMTCYATGKPVIMVYEGLKRCPRDYAMESNHHPGWLCLHNNTVQEDIQEAEDFKEVK